MPVVIPPETGASYQTTLESLGVIRPVVPQMDGQPVNQRLLAVVTKQAQPSTVEWILRDNVGRPVLLTEASSSSISAVVENTPSPPYGVIFTSADPCLPAPAVIAGQVRIAETFSPNNIWSASAISVDPTNGKVKFTLPDLAVANIGINTVEVRILANDIPVLANTFYVWVERSLFAASPSRTGVPQVQDIRTAVRDTGPNDNYLLARLEWSVGEIAEGVVQAVALWNRSWPNVGQKYTTTSFFDPDALICGTLGYLYRSAGTNYGRNDLGYSASGVTVDDKKKADLYLGLAGKFEDAYMNWIKQTKLAISRGGFAGTVRSGYSTTAWWARVGVGGI